MSRGTGILATIGATAPFVGLFGTVWGIMNSFIGISKMHTTNLAVVAPGIAEALLATAMRARHGDPRGSHLQFVRPTNRGLPRPCRRRRRRGAAAGFARSESRRSYHWRRRNDRGSADTGCRSRAPEAASGGGVSVMALLLHHGDDDLPENHEINVTLFIDVILVLLIIFMVQRRRWRRSMSRSICRVSTATPQPRPTSRSSRLDDQGRPRSGIG